MIADNVLNRDFTATAPESEVGDRCDGAPGRRSQGVFIASDRLVRPLCGRALLVAVAEPAVDQHVADSGDRDSVTRSVPVGALRPGGVQYQHRSWRALLKDAEASQSMSRKANCYDNAVAENFFGHLKAELIPPQPIRHRRGLHNRAR